MEVGTLDSLIERLQQLAGASEPPISPPPLPPTPDRGNNDPMENRVTRLETHMEYVRKDLDSIVGSLARMNEKVDGLATQLDVAGLRSDLTTFRWQWVAAAVGAVAIIVGGIIGGLAWIQPAPSAPAPLVITVPK